MRWFVRALNGLSTSQMKRPTIRVHPLSTGPSTAIDSHDHAWQCMISDCCTHHACSRLTSTLRPHSRGEAQRLKDEGLSGCGVRLLGDLLDLGPAAADLSLDNEVFGAGARVVGDARALAAGVLVRDAAHLLGVLERHADLRAVRLIGL